METIPRIPRPAADDRPWHTLPILDNGRCEPLKAVVHGMAFGLTVLMGAYNAAAWLRRRQRHLAINAVIYFTAAIWEQRHVAHHLAPCLQAAPPCNEAVPLSKETSPSVAPDRAKVA